MKKQILETLKTHLLLNRDVMTREELDALERQIDYMNAEIAKEKYHEYVAQLKAFGAHLSQGLDDMIEGEGERYDAFVNAQFEITFMGKTVVLNNGADVFSHIEEIILYEISEYETEEEIENASR